MLAIPVHTHTPKYYTPSSAPPRSLIIILISSLPRGALTSLCLIQDIKVLVSASIDGTLIVWAVGSVPNPGSHVPPTLLQVIFHTRTGEGMDAWMC